MNFLFPVLLFFQFFILKTVWKSDVDYSKTFVLKEIILVPVFVFKKKSVIFFNIFCFASILFLKISS